MSRVKSSDYGVDLEVEIFSPGGHDTGLTFNVQSKGTSKENLEKSVPITLESLKYLCSFDVPAIIFRHSEASGRSYWMWADEALAKATTGAKRIAVKFTDENLWTTLTPARLEKSVRYRRAIKERGRWTRFPICASYTSANEEIRFSAISGELTSALPFLDAHKGLDGIEILVEIAGDELIVSVSDIFIHRERLSSNDPQTQSAALAYSVLKVLSDLKFEGQAERVAEYCHRERLVAPGRVLACDASIALLRNPKSAVDLAILNNLEKDSDWLTLLFGSLLRFASDTFGTSKDQVVRFYRGMIDAQPQDQRNASLSYTLGNILRSHRAYPTAIREYNSARKIDTSYLDRSYFHRELGGILFMARRYRSAAKAYECLVRIEDTPAARLLLGDALAYSRNSGDARPVLAAAAQEHSSTGAEAFLKLRLCDWLEEDDAPPLDHYESLFAAREREGESGDARRLFWAHQALTFYLEDDAECWADLIFLSFHSSDQFLEAVLFCAFKRCGVKPYLLMKASRAEAMATDPSLVGDLDGMAAGVIAAIRTERPYVPGLASGEIADLHERHGIVRLERDPRF
ncbi:DUF4365 domain-containing protein [Agrobacterium sp. SHOUNA12C]|nr:DUF4365 domain-containing protein [Agrobacterium sp. BETTINA12B]MCJ9755522.1 DUF4365 domain-containing protein [Agrobacterium sp. SHOUNA12C]